MVLISCVQILMIYYGGALFRTTPLLPADLAWVILLSLTVIPVDFIRKVLGHLVSGNRQKTV